MEYRRQADSECVGGHLREPLHLATDMAPNSPKWKHSTGSEPFGFAAGEDSSVLVGMTKEAVVNYSLVFVLPTEYITMAC